MKRTWRAGRVILGVLLLSLAGLGVYVWPTGPRWRIPFEKMQGINGNLAAEEILMGFDLQHGLLFTRTFGIEELHGFDLVSGERKVSIRIPREAKGIEALLWGEMQTRLSPDCSKLAAWGHSEPSIRVFDVRQQGRLLFKIRNDPLMFVNSVSFSHDGELLAFRSPSEIEEVQIWDCTKGVLKQTLRMPEGTTGGGGIRVPKDMMFSGDGRYLAVDCDDHSYLVFDLTTEQVIGRCREAWSALFLDDNSTLVTLPQPALSYNLGHPLMAESTEYIHWYRIGADRLHPLPKSDHAVRDKAIFLDANPAVLLTCHLVHDNYKALPSWIPDGIRSKCESALGWRMQSLLIRPCDCNTGRVRETFQIQIESISNTKLSPDGRLLAIEEGTRLSLWDIPPRRSITCWQACSIVVVLALWLGYPRRSRAGLVAG